MKGFLITGRESNFESGHSIFLPAAGFYHDGYKEVFDQGDRGYYWSTGDEWYLFFNHDHLNMSQSNPSDGMAVRPVLE